MPIEKTLLVSGQEVHIDFVHVRETLKHIVSLSILALLNQVSPILEFPHSLVHHALTISVPHNYVAVSMREVEVVAKFFAEMVEGVSSHGKSRTIDSHKHMIAYRIVERDPDTEPHRPTVGVGDLEVGTVQPVPSHILASGLENIPLPLIEQNLLVAGNAYGFALLRGEKKSGDNRKYGNGQCGNLEKHVKIAVVVRVCLI